MSTDTRSAPSGSPGDALPRRIALTLAFVLAADAAFAAVLAYLFRPWVASVLGTVTGSTGWPGSTGWLGFPGADWIGWLAVIAPVTAVLAWAQVRYVRREALAAADARPVSADEYPDLHARVQRLAQAADVTVPDVAVAETDAPNSFAVAGVGGATVVVSTGLLDALSGEELDAVLAHELAHLRNRDAAVMTLATFLPALANDDYAVFEGIGGPAARTLGLAVLAVVGYAVSTAVASVPPFSPASLLAFAGFVAFTVLFGGAALGVLAIPAVVLAGRLSHLREFAADRAGALLAGDPAALASALETLDDAAPERPTEDVRTGDGRAGENGRATGVRSAGVRELCLLPHGIVDRDPGHEDDQKDPLAGLPLDVTTHPPTEERIARLRDLASEGGEAYGRTNPVVSRQSGRT